MIKVGIVKTVMERVNDFLLPIRSPRRPNRIAPRGRARNPAPKMTKVLMRFARSELKLKKTLERMGAQ